MNLFGTEAMEPIDYSENLDLTIKDLYDKSSNFYKKYKIDIESDNLKTYIDNLKKIDNLFCRSFKEYIHNTTRDFKTNEIYAVIFKAIENIKILINQLNNFFNKVEPKDIIELANIQYKSFYKLLRLLQITYFNSTSCSTNIIILNKLDKNTYKEQFLNFVLEIISDELLYCSILTKLHLPLLIYKLNKSTYEREISLIANNFNDVVCFKSNAQADSDNFYSKLSSLFSRYLSPDSQNKLPEYNNLDFINYRYILSNQNSIEAADLSNVIILKNDFPSNDTKYFVNIITLNDLATIDISGINNNFKFVNENDKKYMEYSKNESKNENFNYGDILLYTCVILENDATFFKFSKIDYDSKYETVDSDKPITFTDLFSDNDKATCELERQKLNTKTTGANKIIYVVLRKFLWSLKNTDVKAMEPIIYSDNFCLKTERDINFNEDSFAKLFPSINNPESIKLTEEHVKNKEVSIDIKSRNDGKIITTMTAPINNPSLQAGDQFTPLFDGEYGQWNINPVGNSLEYGIKTSDYLLSWKRNASDKSVSTIIASWTFKKIKYFKYNGKDKDIGNKIAVGDFFNPETNEVLRIPKSNRPINHDYAPSFNKKDRKILDNKYLNDNNSEITDADNTEITDAYNTEIRNPNKKIDVSELLTCEFVDEKNILDDDIKKTQYMEYLKYPSNDKIMYKVYKTYHLHNKIKLYKYKDQFIVPKNQEDIEKNIIDLYKPSICNDDISHNFLYTDGTSYNNNIIELLKRDPEKIQKLINNKEEDEEKSLMDELQEKFIESIKKKKSKPDVMNNPNFSFSFMSGGTRKNKINKKGKSIKNHLKERKQNNKKRKFMNNKPLNIKITIKNN